MRSRSQMFTLVAVFALLVLLGVVGRSLPHPPNFTPVLAAAMFAGFFFRSSWVACMIPVAIMLISDAIFFGFYDLRIMGVVYAAMLLPLALRSFIRTNPSVLRIGLSALTMSVAFFLATNFAVWAFSGMYSLTLAGLVACYAAAIPFFKYFLAGDLFWTAAIFGTYFLVTRSRTSTVFGRLVPVKA